MKHLLNDQPKSLLNEKEKAQRAALDRAARPRLASTIVLYTGTKDNPRILMGQRASRHDFMPSVYVFPGGRVDRSDSFMPYAGDLSARTETLLEAVVSPRKARAVVLTTLRETFEETGLMIGSPEPTTRNPKDPSWQAFIDAGLLPDISDIEVFGRAITPPHRHKRYDTWFFAKKVDETFITKTQDSRELLNVGWYTFDEIDHLKTQRATDMMLAVFKHYLSYAQIPPDIFFSRMVRGQYIQSGFGTKE